MRFPSLPTTGTCRPSQLPFPLCSKVRHESHLKSLSKTCAGCPEGRVTEVEDLQVFPLYIDCFAPRKAILELGEAIATHLDYAKGWNIAQSESFVADDLREQWTHENPSKKVADEVALQIRFYFPSAELCQAATETAIDHLQSLKPDSGYGIIAWSTSSRIN